MPGTKRGEEAYLGIDPGIANCAISLIFSDGTDLTETLITRGHAGVDRLCVLQEKLEDRLREVARRWRIKHICMEGPNYAAKHQLHQMGEAAGAVKLVLLELLTDPVCYPTIPAPIQLKKFVMGAGGARKSGMILGVYKQWGVEFSDDNHADAYSLGRVAESLATGKVQYEYQKQVIDRLRPHTERPDDEPTKQRGSTRKVG